MTPLEKSNPPSPAKKSPPVIKSDTDIAEEVILGQWGNGDERRSRLAKAGYSVEDVQAEVRRLLDS
jgi:CW_7 repeat